MISPYVLSVAIIVSGLVAFALLIGLIGLVIVASFAKRRFEGL